MSRNGLPMDNNSLSGRMTPWVLRILALNAVVLLLQQTLLTSPAITAWLRFDPTLAFQRPWSFFTYMILHAGILHLLMNSVALFAFGPAVERRLGGARFIAYYIYCGLGAAVFSLVLSSIVPIVPFLGASGAVLGVALAFARFFPDAEFLIFPLPMPIKAKWIVAFLVVMALVGGIGNFNDGIAHWAHLGGLAFGWLYFVVRGLAEGGESPRLPPMKPRVPVGATRRSDSGTDTATRRAGPALQVGAIPELPDPAVIEAAEMDRLLDKISANGMDSLTLQERRFLDGVAKRRRNRG